MSLTNNTTNLQSVLSSVNTLPTVLDTSDANATAADILSGKSGYVNGVKVTGTIPSIVAATITPGTTDQTIAAGNYLSGAQTVKGDANLVPENIVKDVSIFGVTGTHESGETIPLAKVHAYATLGATLHCSRLVDGSIVFESIEINGAEVVNDVIMNSIVIFDDGNGSEVQMSSSAGDIIELSKNSCVITYRHVDLDIP